ncbi:hypothetical protein HRbin02_00943 [Candidatus Calditenuaceae archaeon HR02]|nr:hypothetical protein HRbin02_00943 [Candidatus Calditenuaceae archaeon HR02]
MCECCCGGMGEEARTAEKKVEEMPEGIKRERKKKVMPGL